MADCTYNNVLLRKDIGEKEKGETHVHGKKKVCDGQAVVGN
ncbi:hypothetical protein [Ectobacillus panaciterrae]|nr:hypothetical protein [Ectobacillus panaciterrae]